MQAVAKLHPISKARLGTPWKVELAKEIANPLKVAFQDPVEAKNPGQDRQQEDKHVILAPDFDDPEADGFWDEEDAALMYSGEP